MPLRVLAILTVLFVPMIAVPSSAAGPPPVLVIFPVTAAASMPASTGTDFADKLAAQITAFGGITVIKGAPSTQLADYRTVARAAGADMYFSGAIVRVGTAYAVLEELVSTRSGIVTWSTTTQLQSLTDSDIGSQQVHDEVLGILEARALAAAPPASTPRPAATPTVAAARAVAAAPAAVAAPPPTSQRTAGSVALLPVATPKPREQLPPGSGFAVLPFAGPASSKERALATSTIVAAIQHLGFAVVAVNKSADPVANSLAVCTSTKAETLIAGTLQTGKTTSASSTPGQTAAIVGLVAYNCETGALDDEPITIGRTAAAGDDAIRGAVTDAIVLLPAVPPAPGL